MSANILDKTKESCVIKSELTRTCPMYEVNIQLGRIKVQTVLKVLNLMGV